MKILNVPRDTVIRMSKNGHIDFDKNNIISINTYYSRYEPACRELAEMQEVLKGHEESVLFLQFDDVTDEDVNRIKTKFPNDRNTNFKLFSEEDAEKIIDFVINTVDDKKDMIVHCSAGISRSAAISLAINNLANMIIGKNEEDLEWNNNLKGYERSPFPNSYVSRILNRKIDEL